MARIRAVPGCGPASSRYLSHTVTPDAGKSSVCIAIIHRCDQIATFKAAWNPTSSDPDMASRTVPLLPARYRAPILKRVPDSVIPCVGAVIKDDQGRLLLVKRGHEPGAGLWSVPGGRVEPGETDSEALVREMREETGLTVQAGPLLGSVRRPAPGGPAAAGGQDSPAAAGGQDSPAAAGGQDKHRPRHQGLRGHGHRRNALPGRRRGRGALGGGQRASVTADHGRFGRSSHQLGCSASRTALIVLFLPFRHSCGPVVTSDVQRHVLELIPSL